ncbi:hypothetical protein NADE_005160 [Nannochloris sp. 'desiccata']|nr:hypothetical protein KSW81_002018 [Chlorella desiccata (nom. nud.)]KAH7622575.1 hypothetical protein NADE_005160 [Chlorella desiccata (nom. nud.)]
MLSKASKPHSSRGIDKILSVLTASITLIGLFAWLHHAKGLNVMFQSTTAAVHTPAVAPAAWPLTSLPSLPSNPTFGTFVMYCEGNKWAGRTGNNIISVLSAALRAHALGMDFKIINCTHDILDLSHLSLDPGNDLSILNVKESDMMSTSGAFKTFVTSTGMRILPKEACCLKNNILPPLLKKITTSPAASKYSPDSLIIHIRSGDIYRDWPPVHANYGPPPLAFYTQAIEEHQSRHSSSSGPSIIIVTELQNMSPLVEALLKLYPPGTITLQAGTLEEDVAVVLGAQHLVASQGTFAYALAFASEQLKTLYTFNKNLDWRVLCNAEVVRYRAVLPEFLEKWKASSEQIQYLLDYPAKNLTRTALEANTGYCG